MRGEPASRIRESVQTIALVVVLSLLKPEATKRSSALTAITISSSVVSMKSCRAHPDLITPITPSALRTNKISSASSGTRCSMLHTLVDPASSIRKRVNQGSTHKSYSSSVMSSDWHDGHIGFLPMPLNFEPHSLQAYCCGSSLFMSSFPNGPPTVHIMTSP